MTNHLHPMVNIAVKAARSAGKIILRSYDNLDNIKVIDKGVHDYASGVDQAAESIIIETIQKAYPEHAILGEESGMISSNGSSDTLWIIDPLDGTTNFLHGFPQFCISIGIQQDNNIAHGVVYDPIRDELFTASRGRGVQMNGRRLRVKDQDDLHRALIGTGFPFRDFSFLDEYLTFLKALIPKCTGIRRAGAAALDLSYVAAGRLDGFWEYGLKPWDVAAASLFIQEAGGWITTLDGDDNILEGKTILAGSPKIYQQLLTMFKDLK